MTQIPDHESIKRVLSGHTDDFDPLFNQYHDRIFRYVLRLVNYHYHDAQDITAETFVSAYRNLRGYNFNHGFAPWLYRIAHNKCMDHFRRHARQRIVELPDDIPAEVTALFPVGDLDHALALLPPHIRSVLVMVYQEDVSLDELARTLNISKNAAGVRLHRYKHQARRIIQKHLPHVVLP